MRSYQAATDFANDQTMVATPVLDSDGRPSPIEAGELIPAGGAEEATGPQYPSPGRVEELAAERAQRASAESAAPEEPVELGEYLDAEREADDAEGSAETENVEESE